MLGHIPNLTNEDYHAAPGISSSGLIRLIQETPAHYRAYLNRDSEETKAKTFGTAVHMAVLEPDLFLKTYISKPEGMNFATKEGKEWKAQNQGKEILAFEDWNAVLSIQDKFFSSKTLKSYLSGGSAEQSYFWNDPDTGLTCKCRPDYFDGKRVIDIKTAESGKPNAFQYAIRKYRYDCQAGFYLSGMSQIVGKQLTDFLHIVIEKHPPYEVAVYVLDDASIERAMLDVKAGLSTLKECMENNEWPGYGHSIQSISIPSDMFFIE